MSLSRRLLFGSLLVAALAALVTAQLRRSEPKGSFPAPSTAGASAAPSPLPSALRDARYVGRDACVRCHAAEAKAFLGSHHDEALQAATDATVLGDFDAPPLEHFGVRYEFSRKDGKRYVRTEGPDGKVALFEATHTFGVAPLQQYLTPIGGGRVQALPVAWDTRAREAGGARWFHLYPKEAVPLGDELHWTGRNQGWNYMCAECHSTDVRKGYDAATDTYATRSAEEDVSCEACHGPASAHVAWAEALGGRAAPAPDPGLSAEARAAQRGLVTGLSQGPRATWVMTPETGIARRMGPPPSGAQLETCARCHMRRSTFSEDVIPGRPLLETHRPSLLEEGLYHADGQILDEVFEVGSFLQSKMHAAGVSCTDCHDPHSGRLPEGGPDASCVKCHDTTRFAAPSHHGHAAGSAGASCVACHMPARTYMVVHERRDHSLRVPRPDLTERIGVPNACTACHGDRPASWARAAIERIAAARGVASRMGTAHYGEAIAQARAGAPDAGAALAALSRDPTAPAIARATALSLLRGRIERGSLQALAAALSDADPLVRYGALLGLDGVDPRLAQGVAGRALADPVRGVRMQAAHLLASSGGTLPRPLEAPFRQAMDEARAAEAYAAERPEALVNLAGLEAALGNADAARAAYERALRIDPRYVPAALNFADFLRLEGRDEEGERILRNVLVVAPASAELHHALGLNLVRRDRKAEALPLLERAVALRPESPRLAYVLGVALWSQGRRDDAMRTLRAAHERTPGDRDILSALVSYAEESGEIAKALTWAEMLARSSPQDPGAQALVERLRAALRDR